MEQRRDFLMVFALALLFTGFARSSIAVSQAPQFSEPLPLQVGGEVGEGAVLNPNSIGFSSNFYPPSKVIIDNKEYDAEGYFVLPGLATLEVCSVFSEELSDFVAKMNISSLVSSKPAGGDEIKKSVDAFCAGAEKSSIYNLLLADINVGSNSSSLTFKKENMTGAVLEDGSMVTAIYTDIAGVNTVFQADIPPNIAFYKMKEGALSLEAFGNGFVSGGIPDKCKFEGYDTKVEMIAKGCIEDEEPTALAVADLNSDGCSDLVVSNRKVLPASIGESWNSYATVYIGICGTFEEGVFPFKYAGFVPILREPYDIAVDGHNVLIAVNATNAKGEHKIHKFGYDGDKITVKNIVVETPSAAMGPYKITAVDFGQKCAGFAFTSAQINPKIPEIKLANKLSVYQGSEDTDGTCSKYSLVGHFEAPNIGTVVGDDLTNHAELSSVAFLKGGEALGFSSGIVVGDQHIYDGKAYIYFYPIDNNTVDTFGITSYLAGENFEHLGDGKYGGGVKEADVDKYGNLVIVHGYPVIFQDKTTSQPDICPGAAGLQDGTDKSLVIWLGKETGPDIQGHTCYENDADCDGIPDIIKYSSGSTGPCDDSIAENCPQNGSVVGMIGKSIPEVFLPIGNHDGNSDGVNDFCQCTRDNDKDGVGDEVDYKISFSDGKKIKDVAKVKCDNCPAVKCPPTGAKTCSNPLQEDSDSDGVGDICEPKSSWKLPKFISTAYADDGPKVSKIGTVTILINKANGTSAIMPGPSGEGAATAYVDIGRNGKPAAGLGPLDGPYDKYIRDLNDKIRQMYHDAIVAETGADIPLSDLHVDVFAGEGGYSRVKYVTPSSGSGAVIYQTSGAPFKEPYYGRDNRRPSMPPKETVLAGKTITRDDLLKNVATRLVTVEGGGADTSLSLLTNTAATDLPLPSIIADKTQLALPSSSLFPTNFEGGLLVNLGSTPENPLMRVKISTQGADEVFEFETYAPYDACYSCHPELAAAPPSERGMDPNVVLQEIKSRLEALVADPDKGVSYENVMKGIVIKWDSSGLLNLGYLPSAGESDLVVKTLVNPLANLEAAPTAGCSCTECR